MKLRQEKCNSALSDGSLCTHHSCPSSFLQHHFISSCMPCMWCHHVSLRGPMPSMQSSYTVAITICLGHVMQDFNVLRSLHSKAKEETGQGGGLLRSVCCKGIWSLTLGECLRNILPSGAPQPHPWSPGQHIWCSTIQRPPLCARCLHPYHHPGLLPEPALNSARPGMQSCMPPPRSP